jgi:hypothetical protein
MIAEELAIAIISIDVGLEPHLAIHIDDGARIERIDTAAIWDRLDQVHVAHLPSLRASAGAAVSWASHLRRVNRMDYAEHVLLAEELILVLLGLGIEARIVIRIPCVR